MDRQWRAPGGELKRAVGDLLHAVLEPVETSLERLTTAAYYGSHNVYRLGVERTGALRAEGGMTDGPPVTTYRAGRNQRQTDRVGAVIVRRHEFPSRTVRCPDLSASDLGRVLLPACFRVHCGTMPARPSTALRKCSLPLITSDDTSSRPRRPPAHVRSTLGSRIVPRAQSFWLDLQLSESMRSGGLVSRLGGHAQSLPDLLQGQPLVSE